MDTFNTILLAVTFVAVNMLQRNLNRRTDKIMATLDERFQAINDKLDEASSEILAEVQKLRQGGNLTPEQEAALENIETKANSLADISPPIEGASEAGNA